MFNTQHKRQTKFCISGLVEVDFDESNQKESDESVSHVSKIELFQTYRKPHFSVWNEGDSQEHVY